MWISRKRVCGLPGVKDKSCLKTCEERERECVGGMSVGNKETCFATHMTHFRNLMIRCKKGSTKTGAVQSLHL